MVNGTDAHANVIEAITFAVEVVEYMSKLLGKPVGVANAVTGGRSRVLWTTFADYMAEIEGVGDQIENDPGYRKLFAQADGLFVDGSLDVGIS